MWKKKSKSEMLSRGSSRSGSKFNSKKLIQNSKESIHTKKVEDKLKVKESEQKTFFIKKWEMENMKNEEKLA